MIFSGIKSYKHFLALAGGFVVTIVAIIIFAQSSYLPLLEAWVQQNVLFYVLGLVLVKAIGTVWPPIPGGAINIASIPFLGWATMYLVDVTGGALGGSVAYFLGRKWGAGMLNRIFDKKALNVLNSLRVPEKRQMEAVFLFHTLGPVVEIVAYGSGFLRLRYKNYLLGWVASHAVLALPLFYLAEGIFQRSFLYHGSVLVAGVIALILLRKRYFKRV